MKETVDSLHHRVTEAYPKPCSFDSAQPLEPQREHIRAVYTELLKLPQTRQPELPQIEYCKEDNPEYDEIRFTVETEPNFFVPAHMLLPKHRRPGEKLPAVICLQGHTSGMHISLGRQKYPTDSCGGDRDFALQAVRRGYIAVAVEQRGLGELSSTIRCEVMCHQLAFECLMSGRTLQGERIHDMMCIVDALAHFDAVDTERIGIMGHSGGGTTAYHMTALDKRIKVCMPSGSFCTYEDSILSMVHCACNFVPGISAQMEMPDLAILIAPRPLILVNGERDPIFPLAAANRAYETVQQIYRAAGVPENCHHVIGNGEHRFFAADAWPLFDQYI